MRVIDFLLSRSSTTPRADWFPVGDFVHQFRTEPPGAVAILRVVHDGDEAGMLRTARDAGEHAPAVEGRQAEVDHNGVEGLGVEKGKGGITVGGHSLFDVIDIEASLHHQYARNHRRLLHEQHRRASVSGVLTSARAAPTEPQSVDATQPARRSWRRCSRKSTST